VASGVTGTTGPTHEQIDVRSYERWEAQGRSKGLDRENWFEAERRLRAEVS
jgi:hypothetical protein